MSSDRYDPPVSGPFAYEPPRRGPAIPAVSPQERAKLPRERPLRERDVEPLQRARLEWQQAHVARAHPRHADVPPTDVPPAPGYGTPPVERRAQSD